jgi:hypothetical protein
MTRSVPALLALSALALLLPGCSSPLAEAPSPDASPIVVTAPDDYSYLNQSDPWSRPHLHDYWGGSTTHTVMDRDVQWYADAIGPGYYFVDGFYPDDGSVVPQGTSNLTVAITFQPGAADRMGTPAFWYRSPTMAEPGGTPTEVPADGSPITVRVDADEADLPHNALSAWFFEVGLRADSTGTGRYTGTMHIAVVANRGRDIPLFPGHPDLWQGRSEIALFSGDGRTSAQSNAENGLCTPLPPETTCPRRWRPEGAVVPYDAAAIEVRLDVSLSARGLTLAYHGGDTRALTTLEPSEESGSVKVYRIPVQGNGDSPYAKQSLWEFVAVGEGTRVVEQGSYHIEATAFREPPLAAAAAAGAP